MYDLSCPLIAQHTLAGDYRMLELNAPAIAREARPGQFVHLRVTGLDAMALRRPFSIYRAEGDTLALVYKTVGRGTSRMAQLAAGDAVGLIGPLGNGFPCDTGGRVPVLVAGGYGVAPLSFLARRIGVRGVLLAGGRTGADVLCTEDFASLGWEVQVATEDGSRGERGLVTLLLDRWLAAHGRGEAALYACGPDGMLRAVCERAQGTGCRAWVSLDKRMVCGVGACLACVQQLRRPDGKVWIGRVCHDGPVFEASEIVWS